MGANGGRRRDQRAEQLPRDKFVNPYTFVSLPDPAGMVRRPPNGHHRLPPDAYCGRIVVRWRTHSPLLYRMPTSENDRWNMWRMNGTVGLPGSSVKGAVRSVHETLFGGCMRVLDLDNVAVHREPAAPRKDGSLVLAVVETVDSAGRVTVRRCDEVCWVDHRALLELFGGDHREVRTGQRLRVLRLPPPNGLGRRHVRNVMDLAPADGSGNEWVLIVSDTSARHRRRGVYFAAGELTGKTETLTAEVVETYRREAAGTDDVRAGRTGRIQVRWKGKTIGWRRPVGRELTEGDVVWLLRKGGRTVRVLRSQIWRRAGRHPVAKRLDEAWYPCGAPPHDSGELCPSCAIFGSAGEEEAHRGADRRAVSYRSHVRFGPALAVGTARCERVELAPLASPKISSGQFYLEPPDDPTPGERNRNIPLANWGSSADQPSPRRIRGRKYYWHGYVDDPNRPARHEARERHRKGKLVNDVEYLVPGAELESTITFDGLTAPQLGSLIAAIDPARVLDNQRPRGITDRGPVRARLGGARPFGFGTVEVIALELETQTAAERYLGKPPQPTEPATLIDSARASVPPEVKATWPQVAAVLTQRWVPAERIWYPPGDLWPPGAKPTDAFDESYAFFGRSNGKYLRNRPSTRFVALPGAAKEDQSLPIEPEPLSHTGRQRNRDPNRGSRGKNQRGRRR